MGPFFLWFSMETMCMAIQYHSEICEPKFALNARTCFALLDNVKTAFFFCVFSQHISMYELGYCLPVFTSFGIL